MRQRRSKYNAVRTQVDGIWFDSKDEAKRYGELKILERGGLIKGLILQPQYLLQEGFRDSKGKLVRSIVYVADFEYVEIRRGHNSVAVVEDVKGVETDVFKLKRKMFLKLYPQYDFRVVKM